jgi:non-canonical (house-cleaning) NTP pyrophosphatase
MNIAIASTRQPKVEAVKEAWQICGKMIMPDLEEPISFMAYDVPAEGPEMPLGISQFMEAARSRVESLTLQLKRQKAEADFYVGLQGGFNVVSSGSKRQVFLESWACVSDGYQSYFGHSGGIPVPARFADPVIERGMELSIVLDRFLEKSRHTSRDGIWGVLTRDIFTLKHSFVAALIAAYAPYYNPEAYR